MNPFESLAVYKPRGTAYLSRRKMPTMVQPAFDREIRECVRRYMGQNIRDYWVNPKQWKERIRQDLITYAAKFSENSNMDAATHAQLVDTINQEVYNNG